MNRKAYQSRVVADLRRKAERGGIHFAEIPTGAGKSKMLLDAGAALAAEGRCVIVSTANNFLVTEMYREARRFGVVDAANVRIVVGRENYLNPEVATSELFLGTFSLSEAEVRKWLRDHAGMEIVALFLDHFDLPDEAAEVLRGKGDERKTAEVAEEILASPGIWITNHYYLVSMMRYAAPGTMDGAALLVDELHMLNPTARNLYRRSFSPWRLSYLVRHAIASGAVAKRVAPAFAKLSARMDAIIALSRRSAEEDGLASSMHALRETQTLSFYKPVREYLNTKKAKGSATLSEISKELHEMSGVVRAYAANRSLVSLTRSAIKQYPLFTLTEGDPVMKLRDVWARHDVSFVGVSGTIRTSTEGTAAANRWIFEHNAFIPYKSIPEDADGEARERMMRFGERVRGATLTVYPRLFSRDQAFFHIAKDRRLRPPKDAKEEEAFKRWGEALAKELEETAWKNTVVLMTSYENVALLRQAIRDGTDLESSYRIFAQLPGTSLRSAVSEYRRAVDRGERAMLITGMGGFTGLNLHGDYLNTLFIGKLPFEPSTYYFRKRAEGLVSYRQEQVKTAVLTFRQGIGRAIRTPEDRAFIVVADPRAASARYRAFRDFLEEYARPVEEEP